MAEKLRCRVPLRHEHMFALKDVSENDDFGTKGLKVEDTGKGRRGWRDRKIKSDRRGKENYEMSCEV